MKKNNATIDVQKEKLAREEFFKLFSDYLTGNMIEKIAPFDNLNFDLLYTEDYNAVIVKFIDTTEEIFSILGEEIVEVIEEEKTLLDKKLEEVGIVSINYFVFMPFVNLKNHMIDSNIILDKSKLNDLSKQGISSLLSKVNISGDKLEFILARERYDFFSKNDSFEKLEEKKIFYLDNISYGNSLIKGSSGTGKTSLMISTLYRLAKIYPNEKFLYVTFDKYLKEKVKNIFLKEKISNVKVVNFHQLIIIFGKKYNLRLNINSKKNFNVEFDKIFNKVRDIYLGKRYFKGVFVDEAENFTEKELDFLKGISYHKKNVFYISFDKVKKLSSSRELDINNLQINHFIELNNNYFSSNKVSSFNKKYQNLVNEFAFLELGDSGRVFEKFSVCKDIDGKVELIKYVDEEIQENIARIVKSSIEKGYSPSDICVVFPFNSNKCRGEFVNSRNKIGHILLDENINFKVVDDSLFFDKEKIRMSNVFNCMNIRAKVIIFTQLESVYDMLEADEAKRLLSLIYVISSRAEEELYILLKEDEERPGIVDLISQVFDEGI